MSSDVKRNHVLGYYSSPDRGLIHLLKLWPKIKERFTDAELHIFYGFDIFLKAYKDNPERMAWMDKIIDLMKQEGITHHGRIGKKELREWQKKIGVWAYPTDFNETNCITALDCQQNGCVPCVVKQAGLHDTVGSGVFVLGDIYEPEVKEAWLVELFKLMGDEKLWKAEQLKGFEFVKNFSWEKIANDWKKYF